MAFARRLMRGLEAIERETPGEVRRALRGEIAALYRVADAAAREYAEIRAAVREVGDFDETDEEYEATGGFPIVETHYCRKGARVTKSFKLEGDKCYPVNPPLEVDGDDCWGQISLK